MKRRLRTFSVLMGIGIGFFFLFITAKSTQSEEKKSEALKEMPIFISASGLFKDLERPPVKFYHDKHSAALKEEGCGICHPENKNKNIKGKYVYTYPKVRDEASKEALMDSYHQNCLGCHNKRIKEGKKAGAVTCGGCHVKQGPQATEHLAVNSDYYQPLEDPYHKDCIKCHKTTGELNKEAKPLDWKNFYIKAKKKEEATWPKVELDYYQHYQHEKGLEKKCELCHHIYSEEEKKLVYKEGTESSCRDCHKEKDEEKKRSYRNVAHSDCINCHMEKEKEGKKAGPPTCGGCHSEKKQRTLQELADVPRPNVKQKERYLIKVDDAKLKEVPFDHKAHEGYTRSCRSCHHDTQKACKECHTQKGIKEGGGVTLTESYHEVSSEWSCIGCHESKKSEASCAGCHHLMKSGLTEASCNVCHSGPMEKTGAVQTLSAPVELLPDKLDEEMMISVLEKDYKSSKFPHLSIIRKLTDVSNLNRLARYFHTQQMTICMGCHHLSPMEQKKPLPSCNACHSNRMEPRKGVPTLFGAYHRQCIGCHEQMDLKIKPRDCSKCHEKKVTAEPPTAKK